MRKFSKSFIFAVAALGLLPANAFGANPTNPILFVTQVPMPEEVNARDIVVSYQSCVSPFSNHLADTGHAGRGGSLHVRFSNGQVVDLLAVADWTGIVGGKPATNTVAVRNPSVNYQASKAIFSMVIGAPTGPADTTQFLWQLYEITLPTQTQLNANVKPIITKIANQPAYNNIQPTYAPGGRIVFASDAPYNGQPHLLQREEYLGLPTTSGLWSFDPNTAGSLQLLHHSPSGAFSPTVDRAGRVVFSNWDHLSRDPEAVTDSRMPVTMAPYNENFTQTMNGSGNFVDESAAAMFTPVTAMAPNSWDIFPEPRNFDRKTLIDDYGGNLNGNSHNIFLPWTIDLDGTNGEMLNHVGRHEIAATFTKNFKNDPNIVDLNPGINPGYGGLTIHKFVNNFMTPHEDPVNPGMYFGTDAADLGTHGAGQIVRLDNAGVAANGDPLNPDLITVTYITPGANGLAKPAFIPVVKPSINLPPTGIAPLSMANAESLYRTPVPLADGALVASHAAGITQTDYNVGTIAQPASLFTFRLRSLKLSGTSYVPDVTLTSGITLNTTYWVGATQVTYNGPAWELDPAEVVARVAPTPATSSVDPIEAGVFGTVGVHIPTFQNYLRSINAALSVSRNVTKRDVHDRQQPFNLKITWSNTQTTGAAGTIYDVGWIQFLQGDLRRGYTLGGAAPAPGRRVVATPLHDTMAENIQTMGAPAGSLRLGDDGSFAAILPAGKAMTWHLLGNDAAKTSYVKERFWVTFQKGEIRTCANCHGINTADQAGVMAKPTNPPEALVALLQKWKMNHPPGTVEYAMSTTGATKGAASVNVDVTRMGGSTGPVSVDVNTMDGTAIAGIDYVTTNQTVTWADGDTATKTVSIPLLVNPMPGTKTFSATLSKPVYGTLGVIQTESITIDDSAATGSSSSGSAGMGGMAGSAGMGGMAGAAGMGGMAGSAGASGSSSGAGAAGGQGGTGGMAEASSSSTGSGTNSPGDESSGCDCRTGNSSSSDSALSGLLLGLLGLLLRRRRS